MGISLHGVTISEWRCSLAARKSDRHFQREYFSGFYLPHGSFRFLACAPSFLDVLFSRATYVTRLGKTNLSCVKHAYSTVEVACISVFDIWAQRLRNYPMTSDPMWTTMGIRQGFMLFFCCQRVMKQGVRILGGNTNEFGALIFT